MADRISVIVPVYNIAPALPRCLESILAQTYADIEVIAVDDGSSDNSGEILDRYAKKHVNIRVIHKGNGGVTSARLCGVQNAGGDWIGFVDGDDEIEPDMYEHLLFNAKKHDAQISHCGYQMCFADGRIHYFHNTGLIAEQDKITSIKELLSGSMIEPGLCNKLFRKTLLLDLLFEEVMPEDIKINEDLLMNFYLFSAAKTSVFEDWCPYHYIVREGSASRTKLNEHKIYDPIKVKKIILENCEKENIADAQRAFMTTCVYTYCLLLTEQGSEIYREEIRKEILSHREWVALLPKRTKLLAKSVLYMPEVLGVLYPIYSDIFQQKKYE